AELVADQLDDPGFLLVRGRERLMAPFALNDGPAVGRRNDARDPEPGAGPERDHRSPRDRLAAAYLADVLRAERRQRPRDGREVVDQGELREAERLRERGAAETPTAVHHVHVVADDRGG